MKYFRLLKIKGNHCHLRKYFDTLNGETDGKEISLHETDYVKDLEERPEYFIGITTSEFKKLNDNTYAFFETIYTNEKFLSSFKSFLRASSKDVKAKEFENVPDRYRGWYKTPFTLISVDATEVGAILHEHGKLPKLIGHKEIFHGVDFNSSSTLRIVEAKTVEERLKEIEKEHSSHFSATIVQAFQSDKIALKVKTKALEIKQGGFHFATTEN